MMKTLQLIQPPIIDMVNIPIPKMHKDTSELFLVKKGGYRYVEEIFLYF
jgi:hypothetical protein